MTTDPPPRRKWHFTRWLTVLIIAMFGWIGWRAYAFRSALKEAKALGWWVNYTDPVEEIRADWKTAFTKKTWLDGVTDVAIQTSDSFEQHLSIVYRLNPNALIINDAATLRDLSALKPLTRLQSVVLDGCTGLMNVDALKSLSALDELSLEGCTGITNVEVLKSLYALHFVRLTGCTGLTNVDGLKNLSALQRVDLIGCTGLTQESIAALRAALPNADIIRP